MQQLILSGIPYAQLLDDLRDLVRREVRDSTPAPPPVTPEPELLTIREAAALLDVYVATIHEYKRNGLVPYQKLSGRSYVLRADLLSALQGHRRTRKPQPKR
jgi:hypothetical protein